MIYLYLLTPVVLVFLVGLALSRLWPSNPSARPRLHPRRALLRSAGIVALDFAIATALFGVRAGAGVAVGCAVVFVSGDWATRRWSAEHDRPTPRQGGHCG